VIQSLLVSDVRQAIFARKNQSCPYFWFLDEAQCLFTQNSDTENLSTILSMGRSYGGYLILITQSLAAATPTKEFLISVETNFRWVTLFRCSTEDTRIVAPAMPVTGRVVRKQMDRGRVLYMTPEQERQSQLARLVSLPNQTAIFWLRGTNQCAISITSHPVQTEQSATPAPTGTDAATIRRGLAEQEKKLRQMAQTTVKPARVRKAEIVDILSRLERGFEDGASE
jgi:hypothetical protein